jgi:hypothetical protein
VHDENQLLLPEVALDRRAKRVEQDRAQRIGGMDVACRRGVRGNRQRRSKADQRKGERAHDNWFPPLQRPVKRAAQGWAERR